MTTVVDPVSMILLSIVLAIGCQDGPVVPLKQLNSPRSNASWHDKQNWRAEDYFDDPEVVELCRAIEANDLKQMERLIKAGANVNALGKGNMTPLLWAYFDNKLNRFKLLLKKGADPNIIFTSRFGVKAYVFAGRSVTHMASATRFPGYFEAVFDYGGDPNLISSRIGRTHYTPLHEVIIGPALDKSSKVTRLIELGADLNHINGSENTPADAAALRGYFDLVMHLLEAGADHRIYASPSSNNQLIHNVLRREKHLPTYSDKQRDDYKKLLAMLEDRGVDIQTARADLARWSKPGLPGSYREMMDKEVAERKAREAREQKAAPEEKDEVDR